MPPKAKKLSDAEVEKMIFEEIKKQNRPFNHTLLHATLHGAATKTQIPTILDALADKGKIIRKDFGKAKLYWADQEGLETVPAEELKKLDKEIETKKDQIKTLNQQLSTAETRLDTITSALTEEEIDQRIELLTAENARLEEKLETLKEAAQSVDPAEFENLKKKYDACRLAWKKRRTICFGVMDELEEKAGKTRAEFLEEVGLETDEDAGVEYVPDKPPPPKSRRLK